MGTHLFRRVGSFVLSRLGLVVLLLSLIVVLQLGLTGEILWQMMRSSPAFRAIDGYVLSTRSELDYLSWKMQPQPGLLTGQLVVERRNPYQDTVESHTFSISGHMHADQVTIDETLTPQTTVQGTVMDNQTLLLESTTPVGETSPVTWYGITMADWQELAKGFVAYVAVQHQLDQLQRMVALPPDQVTSTWMDQGMVDRRQYIRDLDMQLGTIEQQPDHQTHCLLIKDFQALYVRGYALLPSLSQTALGRQWQQTQDAIRQVKRARLPPLSHVPQPWKVDSSIFDATLRSAQDAVTLLQQSYQQYHSEDLNLQTQYGAIGKEFHWLQSLC